MGELTCRVARLPAAGRRPAALAGLHLVGGKAKGNDGDAYGRRNRTPLGGGIGSKGGWGQRKEGERKIGEWEGAKRKGRRAGEQGKEEG